MDISAAQLTQTCDDEPIHKILLIQPRGMLIAAAKKGSIITWVSDNSREFCGVPPEELLGLPLTNFVTQKQVESLFTVAKREKPLTVPVTFRTSEQRFRFNGLTYMSEDSLVLELEALGMESESDSAQKQAELSRLMKWDKRQDLKSLLQTLVDGVARLTEYDKVMLYRFHPDWHGEVVAETNSSKLPDYLGLHFPATDIPAPARQLFRTNWVRQISDVDAEPSKLFASPNAESLELWISGLRAAAPVHIEYLQNMGVKASLTLSLMCEGELWGLIACHHTSPRITPLWTRSMCEILAKAASFQITKSVLRENEAAQLQAVHAFDNLQVKLINAEDPVAFYQNEIKPLCALTDASDCVLIMDGKVHVTDETAQDLVQKLMAPVVAKLEQHDQSHLATDTLHDEIALASDYPLFSGMLASRLDGDKNSWLVWFRPEFKHVISWGGNPEKTIVADIGKNHPRASFQTFLQQVSLRSKSWSPLQISFSRNLSFLLSQKILGKAVSLQSITETPSNYLVNLLSDMSAPINQAISSLSALIKNASTPEDKQLLERVLEFHEELRNTIKDFVSDAS